MRKLYYLLLVTLVLAFLSACTTQDSTPTSPAAAQNIQTPRSVNLVWTPPSTRADGSYLPIGELAGYKVYMGTTSKDLAPIADIINENNITKYTVEDLPTGSYYFAISAYDTGGLNSGLSQVILIHVS